MGRQNNRFVQRMAQAYNASRGLSVIVEGHYVRVDETRAREIAAEYAALPKVDGREIVRQCYRELAEEVQAQWDFARAGGITFEPWTQDGQPYANSEEMCADVRDNRHLWFFTGGEEHPYLGEQDADGLSLNDKFRAVHDLFGHAAEGYQFGPRGEENAWLHHSQMFSARAQWALTTETRGQNSWVNFGPFSHLPVSERPFAEQKAALLPGEYVMAWRGILKSVM